MRRAKSPLFSFFCPRQRQQDPQETNTSSNPVSELDIPLQAAVEVGWVLLARGDCNGPVAGALLVFGCLVDVVPFLTRFFFFCLSETHTHTHKHKFTHQAAMMMMSSNKKQHASEAVLMICPYSTGCCVALELQLRGYSLICVWPSTSVACLLVCLFACMPQWLCCWILVVIMN